MNPTPNAWDTPASHPGPGGTADEQKAAAIAKEYADRYELSPNKEKVLAESITPALAEARLAGAKAAYNKVLSQLNMFAEAQTALQGKVTGPTSAAIMTVEFFIEQLNESVKANP